MKKNKGFTLVELMMVIVIIAILSAILMPRFTRVKIQAHFYSCEMNEKTLATALETYAANDADKAYPDAGNLTVLVTGGFIGAMPYCPTAPGTLYGYEKQDMVYTLNCSGSHLSLNIPTGYPKYTNRTGSFKISD